MITNNFETIIHNIVRDTSYDEMASSSSNLKQLSVFNTEYRIIQSKKRLDEVVFSYRDEQSCCEMMKKLLTSANGIASYTVETSEIFSRLKESENINQISQATNLVPMTLIACKVDSGRIFGSVESLFCIWDHHATIKENLNNLYMRHLAEVTVKIDKEKYGPIGVIGKGNFTKPMRKLFVDPFGFVLK